LASFDAHGRDGKLLNLLGAVPPKCCLSRIWSIFCLKLIIFYIFKLFWHTNIKYTK
jgi:hypothetical protein